MRSNSRIRTLNVSYVCRTRLIRTPQHLRRCLSQKTLQLKVAQLSTFYPFRGGIAQFNAALYRALEKQVDEIRAFNFSRQYPNILFPGKTQYVTETDIADKIEASPVLDTINPLSYYGAARKVKTYAPDLFITQFWMPFFAPSLGTVARLLKCKKIAFLHNVIPHEKRPGDMALIKYFVNSYDGFISLSKEVQGDLLSIKPDANHRFHLHPFYNHFPPGMAKSEARKQLGIPPEKKVLLYFGFIRDYKGLDLLIESMKHLNDEYVLLIAGEPYGSYDKYRDLIQNEGVEGKVKEYVRYIDDGEVPLFYSAADVCMLTYKSATQSGVVSIAYNYELPVIVTDVGGLKETVAPYGSGTVVQNPNVGEIVKGIKGFFEQDYDSYLQGIALVKQKSSWESLADTVLNLYNEL